MNINYIRISKILKKAYLKQGVTENDFGRFKTALAEFLNNHNTSESEERHIDTPVYKLYELTD